MRAFWRHCLAPLVVSAAVLFAGAPAQAAVAAHNIVTLASQACPAGTNWDNIHHICR